VLAGGGGLGFRGGGRWFRGGVLRITAGVGGAAAPAGGRRGADRAGAGPRPPGAEPYLQRLFAVRSESRPRAAGPRGPEILSLADFELGKTLHRWDDHEVRWARQKSLDRPTLVWLDHAPPAGVVPGVVVRHPAVPGLHAPA